MQDFTSASNTEENTNNDYEQMVLVLKDFGQHGVSVEDMTSFFEEEAENGNAGAYLQLAKMQHKRLGTEYSKEKNINYLTKAIENAGDNTPIAESALRKLNHMKDRILERNELRAGAPEVEGGQALAYALKKEEQDEELYHAIEGGIARYDALKHANTDYLDFEN